MATAGELNVVIGAVTDGLDDGLNRAQQGLGNTRQSFNRVAAASVKFGASMAAAGAATTAALYVKGAQAVDQQAKLARQLDATSGGLEGLRRAAEDAGAGGDVAVSSAERLNQRLGEAMRGTGQAADALDRLGLSAEQLAGMDVDERMAALSDAMRDGGLNSAQMADELRNLGIRNREMVLLMQEGGDAIRDATKEMDDFGLAIDEVDAAQVESANDAFDRIGDVVRGVTQQLAVELAPLVEAVSRMFTDSAREADGMGDAISSAANAAISSLGFAMDAVEGLRRVFVLVGQTAALAAHGVGEGMSGLALTIIQGPIDAVNALIRQINRIPGIDIDEFEPPAIAERMKEQMKASNLAVQEGKNAMHETLMEPMPSEQLDRFVEESREKSREAAEETVEARRVQNELMNELGREFNDEERERQELHHGELIDLEEAKQRRLTELAKKGEKDRNQELGRFAKANAAIREDGISSEAAALRSGLQTMFGDQKAASLAIGALKRFEAITSAYAWGSSLGGPPGGAAAAATAAAAQAATLSDMSSASIGSSNAGSSQPAAGSTSAPAQGGGQGGGGGAGGPTTMINLEGDSFGRDQVRDLLERINEEGRDGGRLVIN